MRFITADSFLVIFTQAQGKENQHARRFSLPGPQAGQRKTCAAYAAQCRPPQRAQRLSRTTRRLPK